MDVRALQTAIGVKADGRFGPISRAALLDNFTNPFAKAVTADAIDSYAKMLGCTAKQLAAVAKVESSGSGYDAHARPKMLFERHLFHRITNGRWSPAIFSDPVRGGYETDSWEKLLAACAHDPDAAFASASWGKFQVLGMHWSPLHYESPYALAHSCVESEARQYELLVRFIDANHLNAALAALSSNPETCRAFARAYNGRDYETNGAYHKKLAAAMAR